jgi:hypothetical protein
LLEASSGCFEDSLSGGLLVALAEAHGEPLSRGAAECDARRTIAL